MAEQIEAVLKSAPTTTGMPQIDGEIRLVKAIATEAWSHVGIVERTHDIAVSQG